MVGMSKACFKCGEVKPLSEFYKHPKMADGHVGKCKTCNKKDVTDNRNANLDHYREYDRDRGNRQDQSYVTEYRAKYPNKYAAHTLVQRFPMLPCETCGTEESVHRHHDDYLKPSEVRYLCAAHHKQWHRDNGEALNP
jgi:hypothetical protein